MANEKQSESIENPPVQDPPANIQIAPDFDTEFNNAFEKSLQDFKVSDPEKPKEPDVKQDPEKTEPESKPDDKKKVEEGPLPDPESLDQNPPGKGSSQAKEGWNALRNNYKRVHKIAQERDEKIKKLESTLAEKGTTTQKEVETLKSQIEELSRYRAMVDIQADPDFVSKYDQPIEKAQSTIKEILKSMGVKDEEISKVNFTDTRLMDQIIANVEENQDKFVAKKLQRKVEDLLELNDKRNETLQDHKKNYKEHLESKRKESFAKDEEAQGKTLQHLETVTTSKDPTGNPMFPFLNRIEVKDGMEQAHVDRINSHNKMVDLMTGRVHEVLKMDKPEQRAEVAVAAVTAHYLTAQLRSANGKIKALEDEIKKISTSSSETEKTKNPAIKRHSNGQVVALDDALASHFGR